MDQATIEQKMEKCGIRPTANRILVMRQLMGATAPMSIAQIEDALVTLDKSSIFRSLTLFLEHHLVHAIADGNGTLKYELCGSDTTCSIADMHVHFYCDSCRKTYCFEDMPIPAVTLPEGFSPHAVNYLVTGECSECRRRHEL